MDPWRFAYRPGLLAAATANGVERVKIELSAEGPTSGHSGQPGVVANPIGSEVAVLTAEVVRENTPDHTGTVHLMLTVIDSASGTQVTRIPGADAPCWSTDGSLYFTYYAAAAADRPTEDPVARQVREVAALVGTAPVIVSLHRAEGAAGGWVPELTEMHGTAERPNFVTELVECVAGLNGGLLIATSPTGGTDAPATLALRVSGGNSIDFGPGRFVGRSAHLDAFAMVSTNPEDFSKTLTEISGAGFTSRRDTDIERDSPLLSGGLGLIDGDELLWSGPEQAGQSQLSTIHLTSGTLSHLATKVTPDGPPRPVVAFDGGTIGVAGTDVACNKVRSTEWSCQ